MEDVKQNVRRILNLGLSVPALAWVHFERKWWFFFTRDEGPRGQQDTSSTFSISVVDLKKKKKRKKKEVSWWSETQTEDRKRAWVLFWKGHLRIPSFLPSFLPLASFQHITVGLHWLVN